LATFNIDQTTDDVPSAPPIASNNPFRDTQTPLHDESPTVELPSLSEPIPGEAATSDATAPLPKPLTSDFLTAADENTPARRASPVLSAGEGEWKLKEIAWPDPRVGGERRNVKILMQVKFRGSPPFPFVDLPCDIQLIFKVKSRTRMVLVLL
jgi:hypothetical protein